MGFRVFEKVDLRFKGVWLEWLRLKGVWLEGLRLKEVWLEEAW